jgi:ABC-type Zn2+ transport system substrate-binding protein/surface adhesin
MSAKSRFVPILLAGVGLIILSVSVVSLGDDQELALDRVPAKVRQAAMKAVKGITLEEAEVEAVLIFELEGTVGEKEYEIEITAEGQVLAVEIEEVETEEDDAENDGKKGESRDDDEEDDAGEEDDDEAEHELEIPVSSVPKAVMAAALKAVKGIRLTEAEVESVLVYELEGTASGKEYEIEITAEGEVIEVEAEDD